EAVNVLLSCGANINCVNAKNRTPLHEVTENGFTDIVEILLIEGASVDVVDKLGKTALLMAIRAENITITDMIIKAERYNEKVRTMESLNPQKRNP
ncbi:ankyrin repeat domain-containing protein, partial [Salmonella sp. s55004]|uniref:ankyrin repeat domain-containing protein n=1 Tax=Salmonella sp. s55004 TaxID=3159675 RepID=UPI00398180A5